MNILNNKEFRGKIVNIVENDFRKKKYILEINVDPENETIEVTAGNVKKIEIQNVEDDKITSIQLFVIPLSNHVVITKKNKDNKVKTLFIFTEKERWTYLDF